MSWLCELEFTCYIRPRFKNKIFTTRCLNNGVYSRTIIGLWDSHSGRIGTERVHGADIACRKIKRCRFRSRNHVPTATVNLTNGNSLTSSIKTTSDPSYSTRGQNTWFLSVFPFLESQACPKPADPAIAYLHSACLQQILDYSTTSNSLSSLISFFLSLILAFSPGCGLGVWLLLAVLRTGDAQMQQWERGEERIIEAVKLLAILLAFKHIKPHNTPTLQPACWPDVIAHIAFRTRPQKSTINMTPKALNESFCNASFNVRNVGWHSVIRFVFAFSDKHVVVPSRAATWWWLAMWLLARFVQNPILEGAVRTHHLSQLPRPWSLE